MASLKRIYLGQSEFTIGLMASDYDYAEVEHTAHTCLCFTGDGSEKCIIGGHEEDSDSDDDDEYCSECGEHYDDCHC